MQLPNSSSAGVTFLLKRTLDFQGADDENIIRDPATGALLGRPFPDFDAVLRTYAPNYSYPAVPLGPVPLHEELRAGLGHQRQLLVRLSPVDRAGVQPDARHRCSSSASPRTS